MSKINPVVASELICLVGLCFLIGSCQRSSVSSCLDCPSLDGLVSAAKIDSLHIFGTRNSHAEVVDQWQSANSSRLVQGWVTSYTISDTRSISDDLARFQRLKYEEFVSTVTRDKINLKFIVQEDRSDPADAALHVRYEIVVDRR